ncbi:MAG: glycosyltransferase family 25 protein [Alphaproteobacteria bacterium]|nr:glycosyltransferase family 25 protein [Alphaproteobacteria bacterium]
MIPVFIISLPEAVERQNRITNIMNDLGLEFEFVEAVDGRAFDVLHHPNYSPKKRLRYFGKHLTGGEIGCTLSHKKIYQRMINQKIPRALIFEDDIIIRDGFLETLQEILIMPVPYDMVRFLGSPKLERLKLRPVYKFKSDHALTRHTGMPGGAHATLMTLGGAEKILKHLDKTPYPIDALMGRSWETKLDWYTVRPGLVPQDRAIQSMIGDDVRFDEKKDIEGVIKIIYPFTRAWFKFTETIGKKYWYYKTYFKDKKYGNL